MIWLMLKHSKYKKYFWHKKSLDIWKELIDEYVDTNALVYLIDNKKDKSSERNVTQEGGRDYS